MAESWAVGHQALGLTGKAKRRPQCWERDAKCLWSQQNLTAGLKGDEPLSGGKLYRRRGFHTGCSAMGSTSRTCLAHDRPMQ